MALNKNSWNPFLIREGITHEVRHTESGWERQQLNGEKVVVPARSITDDEGLAAFRTAQNFKSGS